MRPSAILAPLLLFLLGGANAQSTPTPNATTTTSTQTGYLRTGSYLHLGRWAMCTNSTPDPNRTCFDHGVVATGCRKPDHRCVTHQGFAIATILNYNASGCHDYIWLWACTYHWLTCNPGGESCACTQPTIDDPLCICRNDTDPLHCVPGAPTAVPTAAPTSLPTFFPTMVPTTLAPTAQPTTQPTPAPTTQPTAQPSRAPTARPTVYPTTMYPTTLYPTTLYPTTQYPTTAQPTAQPTAYPAPPPKSEPASGSTKEKNALGMSDVAIYVILGVCVLLIVLLVATVVAFKRERKQEQSIGRVMENPVYQRVDPPTIYLDTSSTDYAHYRDTEPSVE